jgi:hypothetical protein
MFKVEEKVFSLVFDRDNSVLEAKKSIFLSRYKMRLFKFLFINELGTCPQNLIPTRVVVS